MSSVTMRDVTAGWVDGAVLAAHIEVGPHKLRADEPVWEFAPGGWRLAQPELIQKLEASVHLLSMVSGQSADSPPDDA